VFSTFLTIQTDAWLWGRPVTAPFGLAVDIFVRPSLVMIMLWSLALDTIVQVVRAHRQLRPTFDPHPSAMLVHLAK